METIYYLGKASLVLLLFQLVFYFFLRKETLFTANRHFLLGGILASITIPFFEITRHVFVTINPIETQVLESTLISLSPNTLAENEFIINWWQVGITVYSIGVFVLFTRFVLQLFSLYKLVRQPSKKHGKFSYITTDGNTLPFSFFNYIVFNPEMHEENELKMILKHEEIHAHQWHSVDIIIANIFLIFQWFNPFAWFYKKLVEENLEFIADNETIAVLPSKTAYQMALIKASSPQAIPALTTNFYQSFIKKRIVMLNKRNSRKNNFMKAAIVLPLLAIFLWSFNIKETITYKEAIENKEASNIDPHAYENEGSIGLPSENNNKEYTKTVALNTPKVISKTAKEKTINKKTSIEPVKIKITKNTTDAELKKIKADLKKNHDIDVIIKNINRNNKKEITSISFKFESKTSNGSYSITDDSDEGIEDFWFEVNDNGDFKIGNPEMSKKHLRRSQERLERRKAMLEEREIELEEMKEERKTEMKERQKEMIEVREAEMKERREEMEVEREVLREKIHKERKKMHKEREKMHKKREKMQEESEEKIIEIRNNGNGSTFVYSNSTDASGKNFKPYIVVNGKEVDVEIEDINPDDIAYISVLKGEKANKKYGTKGENGVVEITTKDSKINEHTVIIDKDTNDATLAKMKKSLKKRGYDFNYKNIKRNSNGEITRIKVTVKGKGRNSSTAIDSDDGESIDTIVIDLQ